MNNNFQVELIEFKACYQHQMDLLDRMLRDKRSELLKDHINLDDITAARRNLVLQAITRFEGICKKHGANPAAGGY
jgi:hypothetical protein